jgi:hypothetical protein
MSLHIDPQAWIEGVRDAYTGLSSRPVTSFGSDLAYASGRVEGEALRQKHRQEYEQLLFSGRQTRALPQIGPSPG